MPSKKKCCSHQNSREVFAFGAGRDFFRGETDKHCPYVRSDCNDVLKNESTDICGGSDKIHHFGKSVSNVINT